MQEIYSQRSRLSKQIIDRGAPKLLSHQINVYKDKNDALIKMVGYDKSKENSHLTSRKKSKTA